MIGIIGGTAMGQALGAIGGERVDVDTPFGAPSGPLIVTRVQGVPVALLARHGIGHHTPPTFVNYRANIWALKKVGVRRVLATTAVGSLQEHIQPGHLAIPDQLIDKTHRRKTTFFEDIAVHVELATPFCPSLREALLASASKVQTVVHTGGTYVCMEGPAFSTRAESELHRSWGAHLIGMTAMPEAKLAREAELHYAVVALATDYDCWHDTEQQVSVDSVVAILRDNVANVRRVLQRALPAIARLEPTCHCASALDTAILTDPRNVPSDRLRELAPLLAKYRARFGHA